MTPFEPGTFKVMMACCAWGNCSRCLANSDKAKRVWSAISDQVSEQDAQRIAKSWRNFDAYVTPMDEQDLARAAAAQAFFAKVNSPTNDK